MLAKYKFFLPIFFFLYFLLVSQTTAASQLEITSFPSSTVAGEEFNVTFLASSLETDANYYAKALGGESFYSVQTWSSETSSWLSWNSSWSDMPKFTANESSMSTSIKARFKATTSAGAKEFKVRIRKITGSTNYDSDIVVISVSEPIPTPTPSPTPTPTQSPSSTPTPTSTPTKIPTATPKPTVKALVTKKPKVISTKKTSDEEDSEILGLREGLEPPSPTPIPESEEKRKIPITAVLFVLGGLGFMGVAGYPFLKSMKKRYNIKNEEETGAEGGFKSGDN